MQFAASLLALAGVVSAANTITFVSLDFVNRTVVWTPNAGLSAIEDTVIPGGQNVTVNIPLSWIGNGWAYSEGSTAVPGMLVEVALNQWNDLNFFDVSAIVNPQDNAGVKLMCPMDDLDNCSGCPTYEPVADCKNVYILSDDKQTKSSTTSDFVVTLFEPTNSTSSASTKLANTLVDATSVLRTGKRGQNTQVYPRDLVLGKF